jgi:hypothetical protein
MAWDKIKSLFVVTDSKPSSGATASAEDMAAIEAELAKFKLPEDAPTALPASTSPEQLAGTIDFQALYDQAGIPNTDEVEALERFLNGLDSDLPASAKGAAARAFLGAIGKAPQDVVTDAGRKITVVRAVGDAKRGDTDKAIAERQAAIGELQRQIDEQRSQMEALTKELESVRGQCAVEESRLQGARVFFGHAGDVPAQGR